jgi:transposase
MALSPSKELQEASMQSLKITRQELKALKKRIKERTLTPSDYDILGALTETVDCLTEALKEKDTSLGRLCKYLFGAPTETAKNVLKRKPDIDKEPNTPAKGHGRRPASDYNGGRKVVIEHPSLKPGDLCPGCLKGKVYELSMPSVFVHVTGQAPLTATVYERSRLRCNLCGEMYVPKLPVEERKHDESAAAMLALLKYGCGLPLNRIEKLQKNLGHPLPSSTQWDILDASSLTVSPVVDAMMRFSAQGSLIHNDDTTMKVLSFLNEEDPKRKGIYTTAILSICGEHKIAVFMTGRNHAGENLTEVLKNRIRSLSPPIQMCDAASRNTSREFETILANCLAHARRQFVDIVDHFPEECSYVIEQLGRVYHNDTLTMSMSPDERLSYHKDKSGPLMEDIKTWCEGKLKEKDIEPNSELGKAVNYLLRHWEALTRFLQVPGAPLDNNVCERALKYAILHRRNSLFYKTQRGAHVGDVFMSLIHTCQLSGVNPLDYLTWLLKNASDIKKAPENFMPWHYAKAPP